MPQVVSAAVSQFVEQLRAFRAPGVFNPWREHDAGHDLDARAPEIRARQLEAYLSERAGRARLLLVAEAAGYQGAKFTGCAMTSERILLGHLAARGVRPGDVIAGRVERTSRPALRPLGFNEPTATVVWRTLLEATGDARAWVNWNAFAFHPHRPGAPLSNRTPVPAERQAGRPFLEAFLEIFPGTTVIAVGQQAAALLGTLGVPNSPVRHPSMGGATRFRAGILEALERLRHRRGSATISVRQRPA
ncbi:MAG: uracil-DNA glycosylase [Proteobacteria bacterium]|nr:uracil-DNA glycosylase [Pseudomonadota bacterium]